MKNISRPALEASGRHVTGPGREGRLARFVRKKWTRLTCALLVVAALVVIVSSDTLHGFLMDTMSRTDRLVGRHAWWGALAFMGLAAVSAMLAFFSSAVIVPIGVSAWGKTACIFLLWAGWILGGACTYLAGRILGRPIASAVISREAIARYEDRISKRTPFWVVFLFQSAMPSEVPGYLLGMVRYPFWKYFAVVLLLELPWAIGTVYLSEGLLERRLLLIVALSLGGISFIALAVYLLHTRLYGDHRTGG